MKDFFYYIENNELRVPVCLDCNTVIWPPINCCKKCSSKNIKMKKTNPKGTIIEISNSFLNNSTFGLIEMSGMKIRIVGKITGQNIKIGKYAYLEKCGLARDNSVFYNFHIITRAKKELKRSRFN